MACRHFKIAFYFLLVLFWSCTTEKNTWITRSFHNTCTHYNGYFWGELSFNEGLKKLNDIHKDDFSDVIPLYVYPEQSESSAIAKDMQRAINKADTMIQKHTITDKKKREIPDAVKYIKYCYLLNAQGHLYKSEYIPAIDALDYAIREYRKTDFKYEALIWEARTLNQAEYLSRAEEIADLLAADKRIPKKMIGEKDAVEADYNLRIGEKDVAVKYLKKAINDKPKKRIKARYYFILAQIEQQNSELKDAYADYGEVLNDHPPEELEFQAKIFRALLFLGDPKENEIVQKSLLKMLKPTKYLDQRDQIYYALAQIAMKQKNIPLAVDYLKKSIKSSTTDNRQKAISFLALGNIDFDKEDYRGAKKCYDSALISLPKKFKGKDTIIAKKDALDKLVRCLNTIALQDSLQRVAKMSQKDRDAYLDKLIAAIKDSAEKKKREEEITKENAANNVNNINPNNAPSNGKWYFYNPNAVSQGINEFTQKWGNRALEDNWRRSKKNIQAGEPNMEEAESGQDTAKRGGSKKSRRDSAVNAYSRNSYTKNLPLTEDKIKKSDDTLIEAFFNAGMIYKEYIHNYSKSALDFEELLDRYPNNKYKLIVYYELCKIYEKTGNTAGMQKYKDILLTKYPDTEYAMLLANPDKYLQNWKAKKEESELFYTTTFEEYENRNYAQVLSDCRRADTLYNKSPLLPKFAFLEAAAIGSSEGKDAYVKALTRVILLYPKDSVHLLAQSILEHLNKKPGETKKEKDTAVVYSEAKDTSYFWIVVIDKKEEKKINGIKSDISDINSKTFSDQKLQIDDITLGSDYRMLLVRKFSDALTARNYYNYVSNQPDLFKTLTNGSWQTFYLSGLNFKLLLKCSKADSYISFFKNKML